ncbi:MAG: hypothetical protein JRG96_13665 [Deltaproteobacteria bacterium]|nr:hypothetical protein [Deltaproteobacteria bacterium]
MRGSEALESGAGGWAPLWGRAVRSIGFGLWVAPALLALACSPKSPAPEPAPVVPPAPPAVEQAGNAANTERNTAEDQEQNTAEDQEQNTAEDEERKKADSGTGGAEPSALERATAAPTDRDLTRPVGNSLGSRSLGGGDLSDISNRQPLDQRPIGNGGSLATGSLGDRSRGSVASGDVEDLRSESAPELQDRSLQSEHLRDTSREAGSHGDLGERDWQGHPEEE